MADWEEDSPQLRHNLVELLRKIRNDARRRELLTVEAVRRWHEAMMENLDVPDAKFVGRFRGEDGLDNIGVSIGPNRGVPSEEVSAALTQFESALQGVVNYLDELVPLGVKSDDDALDAILDVCAWSHAEWVRIHPFANGNGRTARLWANSIAMRYGLPPFVRLRPRPDRGYGDAGKKAMRGDWQPTAAVFRRMFNDFSAGLDET